MRARFYQRPNRSERPCACARTIRAKSSQSAILRRGNLFSVTRPPQLRNWLAIAAMSVDISSNLPWIALLLDHHFSITCHLAYGSQRFWLKIIADPAPPPAFVPYRPKVSHVIPKLRKSAEGRKSPNSRVTQYFQFSKITLN